MMCDCLNTVQDAPMLTTPYHQVDWASAATAAAMSSAVASNRSTPGPPNKYNKGKQNYYSRNNKSVVSANKSPPKTYYCELCKVSCMGALVSLLLPPIFNLAFLQSVFILPPITSTILPSFNLLFSEGPTSNPSPSRRTRSTVTGRSTRRRRR